MESITLTRKQLYERIWAKPAMQLAKGYGISDVALAKICRKHNIPKPPLGYWAKIEHGHEVHQPSLPKVADARLEIIRITPLPEGIRTPKMTPDTQQKIEGEGSEQNRIVVPEQLESPHPLIERTLRSLRSAAPSDCGIVRPRSKTCLDVAIGRDSIDRAMLIMNTFVRAVEARGMRVVVRDEEHQSVTCIEVEGEDISMHLTEMLGERTRELTAEQKRENEEYKVLRPHDPMEKYPCGSLALSLRGRSRNARHRCSEADGAPLGQKLNAVMAWLHKEAGRIRARREAREEQERQWAEQQRQWEEERRKRREEKERIDQLNANVAAWHKAQRMRAYVSAVEEDAVRKNGPIDPNSELGQWLAWARHRIAKVDPIKS